MKEVLEAHLREYGKKPDVLVSAPGRFHLIGEHSWFCKDKHCRWLSIFQFM